jgi:hypothetical protein
MRTAFLITLLVLLLAASFAANHLRPSVTPAPSPAAQVSEEELTSIRIMFGENQAAPRTYDGNVRLSQGRVVRLIPYRFFRGDAVTGPDSWKLTTKRVNFENRDGRPSSVAGGAVPQNIVPAGITAVIAAPPNARITLRSAEQGLDIGIGDFKLGDCKPLPGSDIVLQKVPTVSKVNEESTGEQHDYPALLETRDGDRNYMMGNIFEPRSKRVQFKIKVVGTDVITRLDIIKNNTFAFTKEGNAKEMTVDYSDEAPRKGENYYYVRIQQIDRNMAWSSPIWLIIN